MHFACFYANLPNASVYEARPVHTVLYIPVKQQARTVTAKYVIAGGDKNGQQFAPDSQIQVFYAQTGSLNVANNTITYGNWQWDQTAGDSTTPGFKVISGSWSLPKEAGQTWQVNVPDPGKDYVVVNIRMVKIVLNSTNLSYTAKDGDLIFDQTPGNVGEYHVELSAQGLANIEKALGTNYAYPQVAADVTTKGTLTINQGEATVTLNSGDSKTYDAKQTLPSGLNLNKYNVTYDATVYSADGEAQTLKLTADDLQIVGNATNVGTYQVKLSQAGQEKLKQLTGNNGANYKWTFKTTANYIVTAVTADAKLNGSNQKTFDGTAVTTAQVNSNGQILVHFTFPGSTTESTYALQDGDYIWNAGSAPVNAGTYTITLNKQSILAHLQDALKKQVNGNVTISADDLGGQASFTITPKAITDITISGSDQSKTYNGKSADLDVNGLKITANGTVTNTPLVNPGITASDFTWYDAAGKKLDGVPTDAGTYQAHLNANTLVALQKTNPNYKLNISSKAKFTWDATLTIEFEDTQEGNKQVGQTITKSGVAGYTTNPNKVEQVKVTGNDKDSEVTVTYTVNTQTGKISYVDSDGKEVGQPPLSGKTGETVDVNPQVPAGWKIVSGQDIPKTVVATADGIPTVTVRVEHDTIIVTPETPPRDVPTGPVPGDPSKNYDHLGTLTKIPTRIITVITPSGAKLIITQKVTFTRTATFDKVTGKVTYSEWKVDGNTQWDAYTAPTFSGYTASQSKVAAEKVSVDTADSNIKITYKQDEVPTPEPEPQPKPKPNPEPKPDKPDKPNKSDKPNKLAKPDKPAKQKESN